MGRRFLHLIKTLDGADCCIWQELQDDQVEFSMMRDDIHCLYWSLDEHFVPDHCLDADEVRFLEPASTK